MKDWLLHNPIADLPGPQFLALFAGVVAALAVEAVWRRSRRDTTRVHEPPPIPDKPDPLEIAYLRGGENEFCRIVVYDLIRRGLLETRGEGESMRVGPPSRPSPGAGKLPPLDLDAIRFFREDRKPQDLFLTGGLVETLEPYWTPIREALRDQDLIRPAGSVEAAWRQWAGAAGLLLLLGGYKITVAVAKGYHNIALLVFMILAGLIILGIAYAVPLRTRRGEAYLVRLRLAYAAIKPRVAAGSTVPATDPTLVLIPAVFGVSALAGGPYSGVSELFKASQTSGGGCGGGCGGGGDGGGGCGGCGE